MLKNKLTWSRAFCYRPTKAIGQLQGNPSAFRGSGQGLFFGKTVDSMVQRSLKLHEPKKARQGTGTQIQLP